jgi:DNA-binding IclR family transcriptional regulator
MIEPSQRKEAPMCAWKGTRPKPVTDRDKRVLKLLQKQGAMTRNDIAEQLKLSRSLTYLSLDRLRTAGQAKRCFSEESKYTLWTAEVDVPCP